MDTLESEPISKTKSNDRNMFNQHKKSYHHGEQNSFMTQGNIIDVVPNTFTNILKDRNYQSKDDNIEGNMSGFIQTMDQTGFLRYQPREEQRPIISSNDNFIDEPPSVGMKLQNRHLESSLKEKDGLFYKELPDSDNLSGVVKQRYISANSGEFGLLKSSTPVITMNPSSITTKNRSFEDARYNKQDFQNGNDFKQTLANRKQILRDNRNFSDVAENEYEHNFACQFRATYLQLVERNRTLENSHQRINMNLNINESKTSNNGKIKFRIYTNDGMEAEVQSQLKDQSSQTLKGNKIKNRCNTNHQKSSDLENTSFLYLKNRILI
jgi:hypothetical protein